MITRSSKHTCCRLYPHSHLAVLLLTWALPVETLQHLQAVYKLKRIIICENKQDTMQRKNNTEHNVFFCFFSITLSVIARVCAEMTEA